MGILKPLLVRPQGANTYELLAGERRWRCARAAGLAEAPVVVHEVDDRTAALLLFAENFHRQDLHFLEEAETVEGLLAAGWTHDQIAGHVGRSASWVARRARLCTLAEEVRTALADPDHPLSAWGAAHFEELARREPAAQVEVLAEHDGCLEDLSPADLRRAIARRTHDLARAPWDLADEALLPAAGACAACPARTSREPLLFPEEEMAERRPAPSSPFPSSPSRTCGSWAPTFWEIHPAATASSSTSTNVPRRRGRSRRLPDPRRRERVPARLPLPGEGRPPALDLLTRRRLARAVRPTAALFRP